MQRGTAQHCAAEKDEANLKKKLARTEAAETISVSHTIHDDLGRHCRVGFRAGKREFAKHFEKTKRKRDFGRPFYNRPSLYSGKPMPQRITSLEIFHLRRNATRWLPAPETSGDSCCDGSTRHGGGDDDDDDDDIIAAIASSYSTASVSRSLFSHNNNNMHQLTTTAVATARKTTASTQGCRRLRMRPPSATAPVPARSLIIWWWYRCPCGRRPRQGAWHGPRRGR